MPLTSTTRYVARGGASRRSLVAPALRGALRRYTADDFRHDAMAGAVVGVVALPLSMALAVAVGAPPQAGLYTAIVGGLVAAALGGSRMQVTGPTAAFIVILAPIYAEFGPAGLAVAGVLAGLILVALGALRLGRLIEFIPHPVTTGFSAGIAVVIATLQFKDLLGLQVASAGHNFGESIAGMWAARYTASWPEAVVGLATLALLVAIPRLTHKVPAPVVAIPVVAVGVWAASATFDGFEVATIGSRFFTEIDGRVVHGIPRLPPMPEWPWTMAGPDGGRFVLSIDTIRALLPGAFAVAMLGAIESLLSAVIADGMSRTRHDPDAELVGQGVANIVTPFFGGLPATGALARTATNIRYGARSPIAAGVHSLVVLAAVLALAPLVAWLPMAALAGLLLLVAWNMAEARHFAHIVRVAPRSDVVVLLACFALTVLFDMVVAVTFGVMLASLLFMRRMAEVTEGQLTTPSDHSEAANLPPGVILYRVSGPLFFGAAQKAMAALHHIDAQDAAVILRMDGFPAMDATGLVALESAITTMREAGCQVFLSGVQPQPAELLDQAGVFDRERGVVACATVADAVRASAAGP